MSLRAIVRRLGGDLYDEGRRANIPAPGHSRRDRSVSLLERDGRLVIHTFGGSDWRAVRDHLRDLGLLGPSGARPPAPPAVETASDHERTARRDAALRLWEQGRPVAGTLSERHCRGRGVVGVIPGPEALRHHPGAPLAVYRPTRAARPALMAGVLDADGTVTAIELTYLTPGGRRAFDLALSRKTVGLIPAGSAVRLDAAGPDLLVAEGVFTALAARRRFSLPAWALLSTSNLRRWRPPSGVRFVLIAADRGFDGEASARHLAQALGRAGVKSRIVLPPPAFGDWDEAAGGGC
ncbi:toprim domain-containing protein [Caulobacter segnis]|uniref:Virulence-associated protein E n=1 Tax=Caulobacter segnis TaxID=88688 RepID=A0A2W5V637_9CAUL|nr:toprim domain-containing protein [Caulobacter segnis]PZR35479.1 MAG: virulence-associated protein E [Caulobacter segnis]